MFLCNVLVVVRRRLKSPPKDFEGGPDACVRLTSKPVLSKRSNLRKRSANATGRATGRATGHATGTLPGGRFLERRHIRAHFPPRALNDRVLNAIQFFFWKQGQYSRGLVSTRSPHHLLECMGFWQSVST